MSGVPAKPFTWIRNLNPKACSAFLSSRSGRVCLLRIPAIIRDRVTLSTTSTMTLPLDTPAKPGMPSGEGSSDE